MKHVILFALLWSTNSALAQSNVTGLGKYVIGVTTPDSLNHTDFKEEDQPYVKGTLTLLCTPIRLFKSAAIDIAGIRVAHVSAAFYDNRLLSISCDYSDALKDAFVRKHGKGLSKPTLILAVCIDRKVQPMEIRGEVWQTGDVLAVAVYTQGYAADCQMQKKARLSLFSQRLSALASDCELPNSDPSIDAFVKALNDQPPGNWEKEK